MTKKPTFTLVLLNRAGERSLFTSNSAGIVFVPSGNWIMIDGTVISEGITIHGVPSTKIYRSQAVSVLNGEPPPQHAWSPYSGSSSAPWWGNLVGGGLSGLGSPVKAVPRRKVPSRVKHGASETKPRPVRKSAPKGRK